MSKQQLERHGNKRQRCDAVDLSARICMSPVVPVSPDTDQDDVLFGILKEQKRIEDQLLSVEFLDEDGEVLWTCDNLCQEGRPKRLTEDEVPYPNQDDFWYPRTVWELPVAKSTSRRKSKLVLSRPDQIREVRIGMHRWKARVGEDVFLDAYDPKTQSKVMRLPIVMETHARNNETDMMGSEALYLVGTYTVTSPEMLQCLADKPEAYDSGWHSAHDKILSSVTRDGVFPGIHDELRVQAVELVVAGTVKGTLGLFGLYDSLGMKQD